MKWFWRLSLLRLGIAAFIATAGICFPHWEGLALFAPESEIETLSTVDHQGRPCTGHVEIKSVGWAALNR